MPPTSTGRPAKRKYIRFIKTPEQVAVRATRIKLLQQEADARVQQLLRDYIGDDHG